MTEAPTVAQRSLVARARALLTAALDLADPAIAHTRYPTPELLARISRARAEIRRDPVIAEHTLAIARSIGFSQGSLLLDLPRLRAIAPNMASVPSAAPALYAHRDCWYANPQAQLNAWIALYDAPATTGFAIFRDRFTAAVANDSERFELQRFVQRGGFQSRSVRPNDSAHVDYPRALDEGALGPAYTVTPRHAWLTLFSASHVHQTHAHAESMTRFSLDFRLVHRDDRVSGRGAPNVDNRAIGDASEDYLAC